MSYDNSDFEQWEKVRNKTRELYLVQQILLSKMQQEFIRAEQLLVELEEL